MARMLIVDDEPAHRQIARIICQRLGHAVTTASDGLEALGLIESEPFDIALVDIMMPGLDGYQLVRRIRANPATAQMSVIALTAALSPDQRLAMREAGLRHWVGKPYDRRTLEHAVATALGAG